MYCYTVCYSIEYTIEFYHTLFINNIQVVVLGLKLYGEEPLSFHSKLESTSLYSIVLAWYYDENRTHLITTQTLY